jgi:hypothetical protein
MIFLKIIIIIIIAFLSIDYIYLINEDQDISSSSNSNSDLTNENKVDDNKDGTVKSTNKMTDFECKVQKAMSMYMNDVLADLRKDIEESKNVTDDSQSENQKDKVENLEDTYYKEVDYKVEIDVLTNKLEKKLTINESSNEDSSLSSSENQDKKRIREDIEDSKNKKTKE